MFARRCLGTPEPLPVLMEAPIGGAVRTFGADLALKLAASRALTTVKPFQL